MRIRNLIYDGSFDGFLSTVFLVFEQRITQVQIQSQLHASDSLFHDNEKVFTDEKKANRVWKGVEKYSNSSGSYRLYYAFLSELPGIENVLLQYLQQLFAYKSDISKDYSNTSVLQVVQTAKKVSREKHRMEAFVRFRLTKDHLYFASVSPDFNVLPLIKKHFTRRYSDQKWLIYDIKRKYGLYYDLKKTEMIQLEFPKSFDFSRTDKDYFTDQELDFQDLWQNYFKSTNIASRKNLKLHTQHVPKRYWKYLSEKQV